VTPARLPSANFLDSIRLKDQRFTPVGYGTVRESKRKGPHTLFFDAQRRFADQGFRSLTKSWLNLSMNPSTGSGGTCSGTRAARTFWAARISSSRSPSRAIASAAPPTLDDFVDLP
jgi:hypothetical protein